MRPVPLIATCLSIVCALAACTPTSRQSVIKPLALPLKPGESILVDVSVAASGDQTAAGEQRRTKRIAATPVNPVEAESFALQLVAKLDMTGKFSKVRLKQNPNDSADMLLRCEIVGIQRISEFDRIMIGPLAGRASVDIHATLTRSESGETLGEATVSGQSEVGMVIGGTTEDAIKKAAEAVANFVVSGNS